jgi:hypothetical protein
VAGALKRVANNLNDLNCVWGYVPRVPNRYGSTESHRDRHEPSLQ